MSILGRVELNRLYPPFAQKIQLFATEAAKIGAFPFDGFRSFNDQLAQYQKGRLYNNSTKTWQIVDSKQIVTKAMPGLSFHNYGIAVDMAFDADQSKAGIQWSWDSKLPWNDLGKLGTSMGFEWAGNWKWAEFPHFQMTYGFQIHQLYDIITNAVTPEQGLQECWKLFDSKVVPISVTTTPIPVVPNMTAPTIKESVIKPRLIAVNPSWVEVLISIFKNIFKFGKT